MRRSARLLALVLACAALTACADRPAPPARAPADAAPVDDSAEARVAGPPVDAACAGLDSVLTRGAFVVVTKPWAGTRLAPGGAVGGCARTFESTVRWRLLGRDGRELASGTGTGGGADGPGPFAFPVTYAVDVPQRGTLEVFEPDTSDGEGSPPPRVLVPVALVPGEPPGPAR